MYSLGLATLTALSLVAGVAALPSSAEPQLPSPDIVRFQSKLQPDVGLRVVRNSGVCETTPGVNQISGYVDIGTDMSMVSCLH